MFWRRRKKEEERLDASAEASSVGTLAVIIPALNEESNIAGAIKSALEDGNGGENGEERRRKRQRKMGHRKPIVVVVDGGSSDATVLAAQRAGATRVLRCSTRGRGAQLAAGVAAVGVGFGVGAGAGGGSGGAFSPPSSSSDSFFLPPPPPLRRGRPDTLLFLHADSRLPPGYRRSLSRALSSPSSSSSPSSASSSSSSSSWGAFETVRPEGLSPLSSALLSACVAARTRLLGLPYGDQALFVRSDLLEKIGGIRPLPLMEDVDLVERLSLAGKREKEREKEEKREGEEEKRNDDLGPGINARPAIARGAVSTSGRRWADKGIVKTTLLNLWTLARWKAGGASAEELAREYYRR